jgi:hypothetical protein
MNVAPHVTGPSVADERAAFAYGHTVQITNQSGQTERLWIKPDHTFLWQGAMGQRGHGAWSLNGQMICLSALTAPTGQDLQSPAAPRCAELQSGRHVGDHWQQANDRGESVTVDVR